MKRCVGNEVPVEAENFVSLAADLPAMLTGRDLTLEQTKGKHESGHCPFANSEWEVKEINMSEPDETQVLIKIRATGMCYKDVHQTRGELPGDFPRTLGHKPRCRDDSGWR
jgi:hypothetical protein